HRLRQPAPRRPSGAGRDVPARQLAAAPDIQRRGGTGERADRQPPAGRVRHADSGDGVGVAPARAAARRAGPRRRILFDPGLRPDRDPEGADLLKPDGTVPQRDAIQPQRAAGLHGRVEHVDRRGEHLRQPEWRHRRADRVRGAVRSVIHAVGAQRVAVHVSQRTARRRASRRMTGWERVQWITLALIPRLGRRTLGRLLAHFGSLDAVLSADDAALKAVPRIGAKTAAAIRAADPHAIAAALDDWQAAGISALLPGDDAFPARLAALDDSPAVLFWRGSALPDESTPTVAIVGARRPTRAAREMAIALAETLASDGWAVVSGLALGIDTAAHSGALSGGGMTVAVLGSGLTTIYPPSNATLAEHIAA